MAPERTFKQYEVSIDSCHQMTSLGHTGFNKNKYEKGVGMLSKL